MLDILEDCTLCPRNCHVNRYKKAGVCGATDKVKIANFSLYKWEEPVISGKNGSGTVFFSHCNLKCLFCQNRKISTTGYGKEISNKRLAEIFLDLAQDGAENINLVTPTHYVPEIVEALHLAKDKGLKIPIVYNTSSYENEETIKMLGGFIDIYLADLKYYDDDIAFKYSHAKDYFKYATKAIDAMYQQVGDIKIKDGLMKKGVIVRILVLPSLVDDAKKIIKYLDDTYHDKIIISIMNQYTPLFHVERYPNLNRKLSTEEYNDIVNYACDLGITKAFIQEGGTQKESFIPDFDITKI